jgi:HSP20 family protein
MNFSRKWSKKMTFVRFEPLKDFENFSKGFGKFWNDFPGLTGGYRFAFYPRVDFWEDSKNIFLQAEIPGVKKEDLKIVLENNVLHISGEKKSDVDTSSSESKIFRNERAYGKFSRKFALPTEVNSSDVDAKFEDGILKIKLLKVSPQAAEERVIEIK